MLFFSVFGVFGDQQADRRWSFQGFICDNWGNGW